MTAQQGMQIGGAVNSALLLLSAAGRRYVPRRLQLLLLIVELEVAVALAGFGFIVGGRAFFIFEGLAVIWTVFSCKFYQDARAERDEPTKQRSYHKQR